MFYPELQTCLREITCALEAAGIENAQKEARILVFERAQLTLTDLTLSPDLEIPDSILKQLEIDVAMRCQDRKPLSKILGHQEFFGHQFIVSKDTLDPRPDSECLIEVALKVFEQQPPRKILDLGTGTGCLILTLLKLWPHATGMGVDVSADALSIAQQNASALNLQDRIEFIESNWFNSLDSVLHASSFDLIISNPPYIRSDVIQNLQPEVRNHDPILALDGGEDGLTAYKKILNEINHYLSNDSKVLFEIGFDQAESVERLIEESRFFMKHVHSDYAGNLRVVEISRGDK